MLSLCVFFGGVYSCFSLNNVDAKLMYISNMVVSKLCIFYLHLLEKSLPVFVKKSLHFGPDLPKTLTVESGLAWEPRGKPASVLILIGTGDLVRVD